MKLAATATIIAAIQLGGCATWINGDEDASQAASYVSVRAGAPERLIALDFVNALRQLESLSPERTTVALHDSDRDDKFTLQMRDALRQSGYGIRWVSHQDTGLLLQYRKSAQSDAASTYRDVYELAIGSVEMRRGYATDGKQRVRPVTPLYMRGADAGGIILNDEIFEDATILENTPEKSNGDSRHPHVDGQVATQAQNNPLPALGMQVSSSLKLPNDTNPLDPTVGKTSPRTSLATPLANVQQVQNVFELGESNFDSLYAERTTIATQVLTFADDSMRLGNSNKRLVQQMVDRFNPQTDVFSVIGCSMGPTRARGGNAALALGRAGRVAEALRFAGVDDKLILDEGCWAGDGKLESMPTRGVVLTLSRRS